MKVTADRVRDLPPLAWLERAMNFEPSLEMKRRLDRNHETFAQYVVRVMAFACPTCEAPVMVPCDEHAALGSCGVQFHRARCVAAKDSVTTVFLKAPIQYGE